MDFVAIGQIANVAVDLLLTNFSLDLPPTFNHPDLVESLRHLMPAFVSGLRLVNSGHN